MNIDTWMQVTKSYFFGNDWDVSKKPKDKVCPMCTLPIRGFTDLLSEEENRISGLCQRCQDDFFDSTY